MPNGGSARARRLQAVEEVPGQADRQAGHPCLPPLRIHRPSWILTWPPRLFGKYSISQNQNSLRAYVLLKDLFVSLFGTAGVQTFTFLFLHLK